MAPDPRRRRLAEAASIGAALASAAILNATASCSDFDHLKLADGGACASAQPPARPDAASALSGAADPTDPATSDFFVLVRQIDFGESAVDGGPPGYASIGYDLDHTCTGAAGPDSCVEPPWAWGPHADGLGGRDNAVGAQLDLFELSASVTSSTNAITESGGPSLAIRVRGYDPRRSQGTLSVAYYIVRLDADNEAGDMIPPRWDGTDVWDAFTVTLQENVQPDGGTAYDLDKPLYEDTTAYYVRDGGTTSLVSRPNQLLVGGTWLLSHAVITADIVPQGAGWSLASGVLAARLRADDLLHSMQRYACKSSAIYPLLKSVSCSFVDIRYDGDDDPTLECDALSWAWRLVTMVPVKVRGTSALPPDMLPACAAGDSPADDHCGP